MAHNQKKLEKGGKFFTHRPRGKTPEHNRTRENTLLDWLWRGNLPKREHVLAALVVRSSAHGRTHQYQCELSYGVCWVSLERVVGGSDFYSTHHRRRRRQRLPAGWLRFDKGPADKNVNAKDVGRDDVPLKKDGCVGGLRGGWGTVKDYKICEFVHSNLN